MDIVETVARAIALAHYTSTGSSEQSAEHIVDNDGDAWAPEARAAIGALRGMTLVYRDGGEVVHELRGAPDDIWETLLDAALTPPRPLEGV